MSARIRVGLLPAHMSPADARHKRELELAYAAGAAALGGLIGMGLAIRARQVDEYVWLAQDGDVPIGLMVKGCDGQGINGIDTLFEFGPEYDESDAPLEMRDLLRVAFRAVLE